MKTQNYWILPALHLVASLGFFLGGSWLWSGTVAFAFTGILLDTLLAKPDDQAKKPSPLVPMGRLYITALLSGLLLLQYLLVVKSWQSGSPVLLLFDIPVSRTIPTSFDLVGGFLTLGYFMGATAGTVGHELMHKTHSFWMRNISKIMLSSCQYSALTIEHVYGHHKNVGTWQDAATARRNEGFWRYLWRCHIQGTLNAYRFEKRRMRNKPGLARFFGNRFMHGYLYQIATLVLAWAIAGLPGVGWYLAAAFTGLIIIEQFNYISHYGIVRVPGSRIAERHSWSSQRPVSSSFTFNITHHAEHHLDAAIPYWKLKFSGDLPTQPYGPVVMTYIALVPALWFRMMQPLLIDWDARFATIEEQDLVRVQKERSRSATLA